MIKWRNSYSIGNEVIDGEHKKLVELVNEMFLIIKNTSDQVKLKNVFAELLQYTKEHFANEEKMLKEENFPLIEEHIEIHKDLLAQVDQLKLKIDNNEEDISMKLYHFLREWLTSHILQEDMKYKEFITP